MVPGIRRPWVIRGTALAFHTASIPGNFKQGCKRLLPECWHRQYQLRCSYTREGCFLCHKLILYIAFSVLRQTLKTTICNKVIVAEKDTDRISEKAHWSHYFNLPLQRVKGRGACQTSWSTELDSLGLQLRNLNHVFLSLMPYYSTYPPLYQGKFVCTKITFESMVPFRVQCTEAYAGPACLGHHGSSWCIKMSVLGSLATFRDGWAKFTQATPESAPKLQTLPESGEHVLVPPSKRHPGHLSYHASP